MSGPNSTRTNKTTRIMNERTQKETGKARRRRIEQTLKQDAVASSKNSETTRQ
jgi:hypothetical protein